MPDANVLNNGRHCYLGIGQDAIGVESQRNDGHGSELDALMAVVKTIEGGQAENDTGTRGRRDRQKDHGASWFNAARFSYTRLAEGRE
ncbi:MAG: hypothetical protein NVSMB52_20700 [Chloroflexota bacterium]